MLTLRTCRMRSWTTVSVGLRFVGLSLEGSNIHDKKSWVRLTWGCSDEEMALNWRVNKHLLHIWRLGRNETGCPWERLEMFTRHSSWVQLTLCRLCPRDDFYLQVLTSFLRLISVHLGAFLHEHRTDLSRFDFASNATGRDSRLGSWDIGSLPEGMIECQMS